MHYSVGRQPLLLFEATADNSFAISMPVRALQQRPSCVCAVINCSFLVVKLAHHHITAIAPGLSPTLQNLTPRQGMPQQPSTKLVTNAVVVYCPIVSDVCVSRCFCCMCPGLQKDIESALRTSRTGSLLRQGLQVSLTSGQAYPHCHCS